MKWWLATVYCIVSVRNRCRVLVTMLQMDSMFRQTKTHAAFLWIGACVNGYDGVLEEMTVTNLIEDLSFIVTNIQ